MRFSRFKWGVACIPVCLLFVVNFSTFCYAEKPFKGTKLHVAMVDEVRERRIRKLLPQFEEKTGIKVTIDHYSFEGLYEKALMASYGRTREYDVIQLHFPDMALFDGGGYMSDITEFVMRDWDEVNVDDIPKALQESHMKYKGKWWGVPMHIGANAFFYRTDIFEEQGYAIPKTWQEVMEIAQDVNEKYSPEVYGMIFMGRKDIQGAATFMNFLGANNNYFYDSNYKPLMDTPEAINAMKTLKELQKYSDPGVTGYGLTESQAAFALGRGAMTIQWDVVADYFNDPDTSKIIGKWDIVGMPGGAATNGGWSVQIAANTLHQAAAWEFLKWIISPELEWQMLDAYASTRISILSDPKVQKEHPGYRAFWENLQGKLVDFPKVEPDYEILDYTAVAVSEVLNDLKTPEEAMKWLQTKCEDAMERFELWKRP